MLARYPSFSRFVEPHVSALLDALADEPWNLLWHRNPAEWSEALFYNAPLGLVLVHEIYARWLGADLKEDVHEEIHFVDALHLVAGRLYGPITPPSAPPLRDAGAQS